MNQAEKLMAKFIGTLHTWSRNTARMIVKPTPTLIGTSDLYTFVKNKTGVAPQQFDLRYYTDTWDKWLKAIEIDFTNINKYLHDQYDCDNFADSFNARMAEYYGWNTAGRMSVALHDPITDKIIGYHRASIIVAKEGPNLAVYAYDPMIGMQDEWDKIDLGVIRIKDWVYEPHTISFN